MYGFKLFQFDLFIFIIAVIKINISKYLSNVSFNIIIIVK
jgi:hypothetical protein